MNEQNEAKHTAGEWRAFPYAGQDDRRDYGICSENAGAGDDLAIVRSTSNDKQTKANAQLMAAAPTMLQALIACDETLGFMESDLKDSLKFYEKIAAKPRHPDRLSAVYAAEATRAGLALRESIREAIQKATGDD